MMQPTSRADGIATKEYDVAVFRGSTRRWLFGSFYGWLSLLLVPAGLGIALILVRWAHNVTRRYRLTNQRLIIKTGLLFKRIDEIELYRVKELTVDYSLLNQMVDIGTISLHSSDRTTGRRAFTLTSVPHARDLRETLRTLVDDARQRRRVRELDIDHELS